jgi:hypothetical protein
LNSPKALRDLDEVVAEAIEEGYPSPSCHALLVARCIEADLHAIAPQRIDVYPTADGEVALDVHSDSGR